ncbi:MAG: cohesin domain-containing protein [Minisyncoccales bacterium]
MNFNKFLILLCFSVYLVWLPLTAKAQKASLYVVPSTGTYTVNNTFLVQVKVNSGGVAINAADATLVFDPDKIEVVRVSKTDSVFSLWVQEPTYSNALGTISFAGGKPTPGYTGAAGTLLSITFKAKTAGTANLSFSSGSVLADDGKGTNILSSTGSGSYTLIAKEITPLEEEKEKKEEEVEEGEAPLEVATPTEEVRPVVVPTKELTWRDFLLRIPVLGPWLNQMLTCENIIILLLLLIIILLMMICYCRYRQIKYRNQIKKEIGKIDQRISIVFRALREEIDERVSLFDKKADLSKEEKRVRNQIQEALDLSEKFINKEIKEVEKKLE